MADEQSVRDLIEALGETLTDGVMAFDDDGRAAFAAADGVVIGIDHLSTSNEMLLHAEIGLLPDGEAGEALLRDLLHDSVQLGTSLGGAFAVDRETGTIALFARRSAEGLEFPAFEGWVGDVADAAGTWVQRLGTPGDEASV